MRLIMAIPTTNRPLVVVPTVRDIVRQTRLPDMLVIAVASANDIDPDTVTDLPFPVCIVQSERGATVQRNQALSLLRNDDIMLFTDDDFVMAPDYLANLETLFAENPDVAMSTGEVLMDGIHGPGVKFEAGREIASSVAGPVELGAELEDVYNCYGCNMALRAAPVLNNSLQFDSRLRLYSWLEDVDFSRQMAAHGRIVKSQALRGVHLGTKTGRSPGVPLGYSQVANPIYLNRKGTMVLWRALRIMLRNFASNLVKSLSPEPEIDRRGRLKGNITAVIDLLRGKMRPERILDLK